MVSPKLRSALAKAKGLGRNGDTMLAHINPQEAQVLKNMGGSGTLNPHTGLPQFDNPSMGDYGGSSKSDYSGYSGGSDLGGYSGSGNTRYSGNYGSDASSTRANPGDIASGGYGNGNSTSYSSGYSGGNDRSSASGGSYSNPGDIASGGYGNGNSSGGGSSFAGAVSAGAGYDYTPNPDVSYGMRFNPGTPENAAGILGARIRDTYSNIDYGGLTNKQIGSFAARTLNGEAGREGELGMQAVGANMANRLELANTGIGLPGNFPGFASFKDVMRGYDANGLRKGTTANSGFSSPDAEDQYRSIAALSSAMSPNSAISQARTSDEAAQALANQYGVSPEDIRAAALSTHYYNPNTSHPSWGPNLQDAGQIGNHRFGSLDVNQAQQDTISGIRTAQGIPVTVPSMPALSVASLDAPPRPPLPIPQGALDAPSEPFVQPNRPITPTPQWGFENPPVAFNQPNRPITPTPPSPVQVAEGMPGPFPARPEGPALPQQPEVAPGPFLARPAVIAPNDRSYEFAQPAHPITPTPDTAYQTAEADPNAPMLPALPDKWKGRLLDAGIGLTPLGLPNFIAGLFGSSVGDMAANAANIPMTAEDLARQQQVAEERGQSKNDSTKMSPIEAAFNSVFGPTENKQSDVTKTEWGKAALAYGYSPEQLADRETASMIKQIYDMGLIPKSIA